MMKTILTILLAFAVCAIATIFAPVVVEAASRHVSRTVVKRDVAKRSKTVERSRGSDDCDLELRSANCAGRTYREVREFREYSSSCDRTQRSESCDRSQGARQLAPAKKPPVFEIIIR